MLHMPLAIIATRLMAQSQPLRLRGRVSTLTYHCYVAIAIDIDTYTTATTRYCRAMATHVTFSAATWHAVITRRHCCHTLPPRLLRQHYTCYAVTLPRRHMYLRLRHITLCYALRHAAIATPLECITTIVTTPLRRVYYGYAGITNTATHTIAIIRRLRLYYY